MERRTLRPALDMALSQAGMTHKEFAEDRCGVTSDFLRKWLRDERDSKRVESEVRAFILEQAPNAIHRLETVQHELARAA